MPAGTGAAVLKKRKKESAEPSSSPAKPAKEVLKRKRAAASDMPAEKATKERKISTTTGKKSATKSPTAIVDVVAPAVKQPEAAGSGRLSSEQVSSAVRALLTYIKREHGNDLLDDKPPINVLVATKQMPKAIGKAKACKPVPLLLPHPFVSLDDAEICLITKDPQREFKDKLADLGVRAKVIGVSKLKKKYHPFEAKRQLMKAYEIFLADARVLPMLPSLLGKAFFQKRRLPTAVDLTKKDLRTELERATSGCTYRHPSGTSNSFQVGTADQSEAQLVKNVIMAVEQAVQHIPGKWNNLQALSLRTTNSVALPFYASMPHA